MHAEIGEQAEKAKKPKATQFSVSMHGRSRISLSFCRRRAPRRLRGRRAPCRSGVRRSPRRCRPRWTAHCPWRRCASPRSTAPPPRAVREAAPRAACCAASASFACFSRVALAIALGAAARVGERLLVSRVRRVRLLLEAFRRREIVADALAALGHDRADTRQRDLRHQHVKQHKADRQPDELRREILRLERRECTVSRRGARYGRSVRPFALALPKVCRRGELRARTAATARSEARRCRALR